jgi:periplasmic protein TonB
MLGFDQTPSFTSAAAAPARAKEQKKEPELFSSYTQEASEEPKKSSGSRFQRGKGMIVFAAVLASAAIVLAPQAPWHPRVLLLWARGQRSLHAWLNPQPVTTPVAPTAHEDFGRAGDEYKLPVAENIPDATTDPSQIRVLPVIDPTAKQPNAGANAGQATPPVDASAPANGDPSQTTPVTAGGDTQPAPVTPAPIPAAADSTTNPAATVPTSAAPQTAAHTDPPAPAPAAPQTTPPAPATTTSAPANPPASTASNNAIPSSLKSQMASMTPDASGNKPPEAALPAIEPVSLPESTVRTFLVQQADPAYPDSAKGQQGSVVLAVLIGRDGTVEDAKFLQGSLAFARSAIDAVKQWKFKPYTMNGRAVSLQTQITLTFKPAA